MVQVLSQDEIDALLKGVSDGEVGTDAEAEPERVEDLSGVISYDITSRDKIVADQMPALDVIHDGFARLLRSSLSATLRKAADVRPLSSEMLKFETFLEGIPMPSSLNLIRMEPLPGLSILVVEAKLVFAFVDCYFGGSGDQLKIEGRDFSAIEQNVMKTFVNNMLDDLKEAWEPISLLDFQLVRSEINPQFVGVVSGDDIVFVVSFEVELEKTRGNLVLCIPYSTMEPIKAKLTGIQKVELGVDEAWIKSVKEHLRNTVANMWVELGKTTVSVRDILSLQVGDVIQLQKDVKDELELKVEGVPKFRGHPGLIKNHKALTITSVVPTRGNVKTNGRK